MRPLLDFEQGINVYTDDPESWFQKIRVKLDGSYSRLETKIYHPDLTNSLCGDDIARYFRSGCFLATVFS